MKRGIALIICLFAMTIQAHLTHAADASSHEDKSASVKRKAYNSDDLDQKEKKAARNAAYDAAYHAANKEKIAAKNAANKEKIAALAAGLPAALASLQDRIDKEQDQPGADENPFLKRYNEACTEEQMNPATPRAVIAADILCNLVKNLQSEQAALSQGDPLTFLQFRGDEVKPLSLCVHTLPGFDSQV